MDISELLIGGYKAFLLLGIPIALASLVVGTLVAALQSATNIQESGSGYVIKLVACIVIIGMLLPAEGEALKALLVEALK